MSIGQNNDEKFRRPTLKKSVLTMDLEGDYASPSPVSNRKALKEFKKSFAQKIHALSSLTIILLGGEDF